MPECSICRNPQAAGVIARIYTNELTIREAARMLDVSYPMLWHHLRFHEGKARADIKPDEELDALAILREIALILKERLDQLRNLPIGFTHERMITSDIRELRCTLMDLERLAGRLRTAPIIQFQQINILYEKVLTFLTRELCEECKSKVKNFLREVSK